MLDRAVVERLTDLDAVRAAVHRSFVALTPGRATLPGVLHRDLGRERGDLHVKGAWLHEETTFTIKVAGAFPGKCWPQTARGRPP